LCGVPWNNILVSHSSFDHQVVLNSC